MKSNFEPSLICRFKDKESHMADSYMPLLDRNNKNNKIIIMIINKIKAVFKKISLQQYNTNIQMIRVPILFIMLLYHYRLHILKMNHLKLTQDNLNN